MCDPTARMCPLSDGLRTDRELAVQDVATGVSSMAGHRVYDTNGDLKSASNTAECLFGFTAWPAAEPIGWQNNLNRWYDAKVGRWLEEDPLGLEAGQANTDGYCGNSPTDATDANGLSAASEAIDYAANELVNALQNAAISEINSRLPGNWSLSKDGVTYVKSIMDSDHNITTIEVSGDKSRHVTAVVSYNGDANGAITCTWNGQVNANGKHLSQIKGQVTGDNGHGSKVTVVFKTLDNGKIEVAVDGRIVVGGVPVIGTFDNTNGIKGRVETKARLHVFGRPVDLGAGAAYGKHKWSAVVTISVNGIFTITVGTGGKIEVDGSILILDLQY